MVSVIVLKDIGLDNQQASSVQEKLQRLSRKGVGVWDTEAVAT